MGKRKGNKGRKLALHGFMVGDLIDGAESLKDAAKRCHMAGVMLMEFMSEGAKIVKAEDGVVEFTRPGHYMEGDEEVCQRCHGNSDESDDDDEGDAEADHIKPEKHEHLGKEPTQQEALGTIFHDYHALLETLPAEKALEFPDTEEDFDRLAKYYFDRYCERDLAKICKAAGAKCDECGSSNPSKCTGALIDAVFKSIEAHNISNKDEKPKEPMIN